MKCPKCNSIDWDWANIGFSEAKQCLDCGEIFFGGSFGKPWVEITKGQIDDCLQHSDNYGSTPYDFAWAIEHICRLNNGYPPHENFKPEVSGSIKWNKPK